MKLAPFAAVAITVLLWASAFSGIRAALLGFSPGGLAALRYLVASAAFVPLAARTGLLLPPRRDLPRIALAGGLGIAVYNLALNTGEMTVSAGAASFIINTGPLFTALLAWRFLGERLWPWALFAMAVSFLGVAVIALGESRGLRLGPGALLVLLAAVSQAAQFVLQKPLLERHGALATTRYLVWAGTLFLTPLLPGALAATTSAPRAALGAVLYLGVFPAAIAYLAWSVALARLGVSRAVSALYLVPPVATAMGFIWLREVPSILTLLGGAMAIGGVVLFHTVGQEPQAIPVSSQRRG